MIRIWKQINEERIIKCGSIIIIYSSKLKQKLKTTKNILVIKDSRKLTTVILEMSSFVRRI